MTAEQYVQRFIGEVTNAGRKYGVNPIALLSQGVAEIGYATSSLFAKTNNPGNITAFGNTNEYWNGEFVKSASSGLKFRKYKTTQAGWYDKGRLLSEKYPQAARVSNDIPAFARAIAYSPYISEVNGDNRAQYQANIIANAKTIIAAVGGTIPNWSASSSTGNKTAKDDKPKDELKTWATWLIVGTVAAVTISSLTSRPPLRRAAT